MATAFLHGFSKRHIVAAVMLCTAALQASAAHSRPDKLLGGEMLTSGEYLTSPNGQARLQMRADGNLVLTRLTDGAQLWALGTVSPGAYAALQSNGNFAVFGSGGQLLWQTGTTNSPGAQLVTQSDHNLVLYSTSTVRWAPLWNTVTGNGNYSTPVYEPAYWNDMSTAQLNNNCYNYSNNRRTDTFAQPGRNAGITFTSASQMQGVHRAQRGARRRLAGDHGHRARTTGQDPHGAGHRAEPGLSLVSSGP